MRKIPLVVMTKPDYLACIDCNLVLDQCACDGRHRPMPKRVDWPRLITMLDATYKYGDGGLSGHSGIAPPVLTDARKDRVYSWDNGVTLWNLAVQRLSTEKINSCIIHGPKTLEW